MHVLKTRPPESKPLAISALIVPENDMPLENYEQIATCANSDQPNLHWIQCSCTPLTRTAGELADKPFCDPPSDNILLVAFRLLQMFVASFPSEPRVVDALFYALVLSRLESELEPIVPPDTDEEMIYAYKFLGFPPLRQLLEEAVQVATGTTILLPAFDTLCSVLLPHYKDDPSASCAICKQSVPDC